MSESLSPHATDTASPHFGHAVMDLDEGTWFCVTCDPDRAVDYIEWVRGRLEERTTALLQAAEKTEAIVAWLRGRCA
ncbi:MAG TPA: hypothetical protein VKN16_21510 [Methylomirabilota bacterium]|nr:hypothetical protein [Methylomirabilota bacterium]